MNYQTFLEQKSQSYSESGFAPLWMPDFLFDFQKYLVEWALKKGRCALFEDCGLGKSPQFLVWAENIVRKTNKNVLILTPLAVSHQTILEGEKFGIEVKRSRDGKPHGKITVTNYQQLEKFNSNDYVGVVCDECFPPDTLIDVFNIDKSLTKKYIKDIKIGDKIYNAYGGDNVKQLYKRQINRAVSITIGTSRITCSENHPFFTLHGWKCAQDLQPDDYIMETESAMCLVRGNFQTEICSTKNAKILQSILLSEMENEDTREYCKSSQSRSSEKEGSEKKFMVSEWKPNSNKRTKENYGIEPDVQSRDKKESIINIACNEAQTFRAWGKWTPDDIATANNEGCNIRELDTGISYITGKTKTRFSDMLQSRLRQSRLKNSNRDRRKFSLYEKRKRQQKGYNAGFVRVESIEILEQGHPELEKYRDAEGNIYFYDIKAERHPSFSVNGLLVHNSSILKNFNGKTKKIILEFQKKIQYRLLCTATPSPNDYPELGTSSEVLGYMGYVDMLTKYFKNDQNSISQKRFYGKMGIWRFKGHAEIPFWKWMCSWARAIRKPSDIGFSDNDFLLPDLLQEIHIVKNNIPFKESLFTMEAITLDEQREERKITLTERCEKVKELTIHDKPYIAWCHMNSEGDYLEKILDDAVQVSGGDTDENKESKFLDFEKGNIRGLITKPKIGAWGLNFQHCSHQTLFPSHSFEQFYQCIRRSWRYGQKNKVKIDIVSSEGERMVLKNLQRKELQAEKMFSKLIYYMKDVLQTKDIIKKQKEVIPSWL